MAYCLWVLWRQVVYPTISQLNLKKSCLKNCPPAPSSLGANFLVLRDESCQLTPVSNATIWHPNWKVQANVERIQWEKLSPFFRRNRMKKCKHAKPETKQWNLRAGLLNNDGPSTRHLLSNMAILIPINSFLTILDLSDFYNKDGGSVRCACVTFTVPTFQVTFSLWFRPRFLRLTLRPSLSPAVVHFACPSLTYAPAKAMTQRRPGPRNPGENGKTEKVRDLKIYSAGLVGSW